MKVLSLFDGLACGAIAFTKMSIPIDRYVAYEIDKYAKQQAERMSREVHINAILKAKKKRHLVYG